MKNCLFFCSSISRCKSRFGRDSDLTASIYSNLKLFALKVSPCCCLILSEHIWCRWPRICSLLSSTQPHVSVSSSLTVFTMMLSCSMVILLCCFGSVYLMTLISVSLHYTSDWNDASDWLCYGATFEHGTELVLFIVHSEYPYRSQFMICYSLFAVISWLAPKSPQSIYTTLVINIKKW